MQSDAIILSILDRYENNQPVTIEEKAVLHTWLVKKLRKGNFITSNPPMPVRIRTIRGRLRLWQYVFIILTLLAILLTLYMFAAKTRNSSTSKSDDHVYSHYQEIRKAGGENRLEFS